jgi:hypothetical protein
LNKKAAFAFLAPCFFLFLAHALCAEPLYSSTWGFRIDLPEGYQYVDGNSFDRFSFEGPAGAQFVIAVYNGTYSDAEQMAADINRRLGNNGETAFFNYGNKAAVLMELVFMDFAGWGICVELTGNALLLALAYAPAEIEDMDIFHLSALDSIAPSETENRKPGPITEFSYPRGRQQETAIAGTELITVLGENDAEAAQSLVDREFALLYRYSASPDWQEAWIRFYRAIYRDSWDRIADAVSRLAINFSADADEHASAEKALAWVQGFQYERDPEGSDFVNLVTALTEGRGDCDSRAMLWAMVLRQADIPSAMMVSQRHSHAMGLADIEGGGARFAAGGVQWLVAETTARVGIGLIDSAMSDVESGLAVLFA